MSANPRGAGLPLKRSVNGARSQRMLVNVHRVLILEALLDFVTHQDAEAPAQVSLPSVAQLVLYKLSDVRGSGPSFLGPNF